MTSQSLKLPALAALAATFACAPLLAQDVKVNYDHSAPLNKVKSYTWGKVQASDPLIEPRITAAVDHVLQGEGLRLVAKNPDVILNAIDANKNSSEYTEFYKSLAQFNANQSSSNSGFDDSGSTLAQMALGSLVVDMYDARTGKLIWRGVAVEPQEEKKRKIEDDIDKAVNKMFTRFPPKSAGPVAPNQVEVPVGTDNNRTTGNH